MVKMFQIFMETDKLADNILSFKLPPESEPMATEFGKQLKNKWPSLRVLLYVGTNPIVVREL